MGAMVPFSNVMELKLTTKVGYNKFDSSRTVLEER